MRFLFDVCGVSLFNDFAPDILYRFFCFVSNSFLLDDVEFYGKSKPISKIDVLAVVLWGLGIFLFNIIKFFCF